MYKIDFITHFVSNDAHDMSSSTIEFVYDYNALLSVFCLSNDDVDSSVLKEYEIIPNDIYDHDNVYRAMLLQDKRYEIFLRDLNCAIIDSRPAIIDGIDSYDQSEIKQLIVNNQTLATTNHISDYDVDMISASHVFDYSAELMNDEFDIDEMTIYDMFRMMNRFIDIVAMMNNEN